MLLRGEKPWTIAELRAVEALKQLGWTPRDMAACASGGTTPRTSGAFDRALDALFDRTPEEAIRFANQLAAEPDREPAEIRRPSMRSALRGFLIEAGLQGRARA